MYYYDNLFNLIDAEALLSTFFSVFRSGNNATKSLQVHIEKLSPGLLRLG